LDSILGIDIGTTNIKVIAFDLNGNTKASATRVTTTRFPSSSQSEFDVEAIWSDVCACLNEITNSPLHLKIRSIGITSFGEANVLIDKNDKPVFPMITWFDQRSILQAQHLENILGAKKLHSITGQFVSTKLGICKVMWVKDNYPEAFSRAYKCLTMQDFISYKLTGRFATDYSMASRMMCFDIHTKQWSKEILEAVDIPSSLFPEIQPGGAYAGPVTSPVSEMTGVESGTPVYMGGHDHPCAAVSINIFDKGIALDSMGTAENTLIAVREIPSMDKCFENLITVYPHMGEKLFRLTTSMQAYGAALNWAGGTLMSPGCPNLSPSKAFDHYLEQSQGGATDSNLIFVPSIRGLQEQPLVRGAFFGIDDRCGLSDFARAVAEGLAFETKRCLRRYEKALGLEIDAIRSVGGPTNSPIMTQIKATVLNKRIEVPRIKDGACLGAAIIAAKSANIISQYPISPNTSISPEKDKVEELIHKYHSYLRAQEFTSGFYESN